MSKKYIPEKIEKKWQKKWAKSNIYRADDSSKDPKKYILIEFPYPSGERLHVGHARSYCALDAVVRMNRMKGFNVMYPFGWDAFGLPAENYAIKTGIHPSITVSENIKNSKKQAISWGLSVDWDREINTTDPNYYKWTQWIFLQLFNKGLAYMDEIPVNWCPSCKINLANEEVVAGTCERCGAETTRRTQKQWLLKITEYADRLLDDLETVDYRNDIKQQQVNWIGRKYGAEISYPIEDFDGEITCFTTRPDTNYGATFIVLSPEHKLSSVIPTEEQKNEVENYIRNAINKSELERIADTKAKSGVFTGRYALNRLNNSKMPIYIADFVLESVGTGAVVGVPGHDLRDFEFAKAFDLSVIRVVKGPDNKDTDIDELEDVYVGEGENINSEILDGLKTPVATDKIIKHLEDRGWGKKSVSFHLRDWVFSRQHYWGEPIPIIHCEKCGEVPVDESDLPVELPHVDNYLPTDTGDSPLAAIEDWVNTKCPKCGGKAKRETDTMPNWAGSSWYFIRYVDPNNDKAFADFKKQEKWMPVDWYNGGMEHTTLHLLYSRFWYKFLYDQNLVPFSEPYKKRSSHGVVLGTDGSRMSKSKNNVINPDDVVEAYGADALRMYMMFIGPFEQTVTWSNESISGVKRFLNKLWDTVIFAIENDNGTSSTEVLKLTNRLVDKVQADLTVTKFNTAVAAFMETVNSLQPIKEDIGKDCISILIKTIAPFAPYLSEELWKKSGEKYSVHTSSWPEVNKEYLQDENIELIVQVNGKLRGTVEVGASKIGNEQEVKKIAIEELNMREKYEISEDTRCVYVEGKVLNFIAD